MANIVNKRFTFSTPDHAIGNPEDEPAVSVDDPQTLISLLKAILQNGSLTAAALAQGVGQRLDDLERRVKALEQQGP